MALDKVLGLEDLGVFWCWETFFVLKAFGVGLWLLL